MGRGEGEEEMDEGMEERYLLHIFKLRCSCFKPSKNSNGIEAFYLLVRGPEHLYTAHQSLQAGTCYIGQIHE